MSRDSLSLEERTFVAKKSMNKTREPDHGGRCDILDPRHIAQLQSLKVSGKATLFHELSAIFRREAPVRMKNIRLAVDSKDSAELAKLSHGFVGSLASMGARQMQTTVKSLELAAVAGDWTAVSSGMEQVEESWKRLLSALEHFDEGARP